MDWFPVYLTLKIALFSTVCSALAGIPLGWLLAIGSFRGKNLLSSLVTLPMVLPPTVLGYYLLTLLGRQSALGTWLWETWKINLIFTWQGAVIAASLVTLPLMVRSVQGGIQAVDSELEEVARSLGKNEWTVFFRVTLPLAWEGVLTGLTLSFTRAMGEFGATLMVAGNIPGKTQTLSVAIYDAVQGGNYQEAKFLVLLISLLTISFLLGLQFYTKGKRW